MKPWLQLNRMELAGSLGDLGTILPLFVGMILINGLSPQTIFWGVGLFYTLSGIYFRVTCPVEPMFVPVITLGITLATNLAAGFIAGIAIAYLLRCKKINI